MNSPSSALFLIAVGQAAAAAEHAELPKEARFTLPEPHLRVYHSASDVVGDEALRERDLAMTRPPMATLEPRSAGSRRSPDARNGCCLR